MYFAWQLYNVIARRAYPSLATKHSGPNRWHPLTILWCYCKKKTSAPCNQRYWSCIGDCIELLKLGAHTNYPILLTFCMEIDLYREGTRDISHLLTLLLICPEECLEEMRCSFWKISRCEVYTLVGTGKHEKHCEQNPVG